MYVHGLVDGVHVASGRRGMAQIDDVVEVGFRNAVGVRCEFGGLGGLQDVELFGARAGVGDMAEEAVVAGFAGGIGVLYLLGIWRRRRHAAGWRTATSSFHRRLPAMKVSIFGCTTTFIPYIKKMKGNLRNPGFIFFQN